MGKRISLVLVGILAAALLWADDDIRLPHVTVYGTATLNVAPDQLLWYVSVENKGGVLETVAEEHGKTVEKVLALLKQSQVESKDLQTSSMEFGENWEYRNNSRVKEGYRASTYISFKLKDFGKYKDLWMGLAKIPNVSVQNVGYDHTDRIKFQNETRQKALLAAKEKALALAKTLESEIAEPLLVEELSASPDYVARSSNTILNWADSRGDSQPDASLAPGRIPIQIRVKAAFRLLTPGK